MIELKNGVQLNAAIKRARANAKNMLVQMTSVSRQYRVVNRKNGYDFFVELQIREDGRRTGHCTCAAGELDMLCKHIAAALALNIYLAEQDLLHGMAANAK